MMNRVFLGWKAGALAAAADFLCDKFVSNGLVDLTHHTMVLPNRRAGRRLREILIEVAEKREVAIFPPQVATVNRLPELLYEKKLPFASALVQQLAWAEALKNVARRTLKKVIVQYPDTLADPRWLELGALLQRQHLELTEHRLDFKAVADQGKELEGFGDFARWNALAKIQRDYLDLLHKLELWDRQTARNFAIDNKECSFDGQLVLLGAVDLSRTTKAMLSLVGDKVTSLVVGDTNMSHYFDEYGCVEPDAWQSHNLNIEDHQILLADGPSNQADAVVYAMGGFNGQYAAEDFTIGVPDAAIVPYVESNLKQFDINVRWGPGRVLTASAPFQWLRLTAEYLSSFRYESLAELMRHTDTQRYLVNKGYLTDPVKELDRYFDKHLPDTLHAQQPHAGDLPKSVEMICDLLKPLTGSQSPKRNRKVTLKKPAAWGDLIHDVLMLLYDCRQLNLDEEHDRATLKACEQINQSVERFADLPESLTPDVAASTAILMLLSQVDEDEIPPASGKNVVEMVGWLDLPLDDAKVAIVTSMNDGVVPKSVSSDVFLPNTFRQTLGLDDNARRYARDAYAVHVLLNSRMAVRFIIGRRTASNDPLRPSRLLMSCDREKLPQRCLRLFQGAGDCKPIVMPVQNETMMFEVPRPGVKEICPIESLSVSDFARYLNCPYRFYLTKVQRLKTMDDRTSEINATTFGDLTHEVLELFGESEFKDSSDASEIRLYLREQVAKLSQQRFGKQPKPTVQVQVAQLMSRLGAFAEKQAEWRMQGWTILKTELVEDEGTLEVDGKPLQLKGRIDRIDTRTVDGVTEYAVLDYKTSDKVASPEEKHLKKRDGKVLEHWLDLQLPLYLHLLDSLPEIKGHPIRLGYVLLPSDSKHTQFAIAQWEADDLEVAVEAAHEIVRRVRQQVFWPPTDPYPFKNSDGFAAIVQNGIFGRIPFVEPTEAVA